MKTAQVEDDGVKIPAREESFLRSCTITLFPKVRLWSFNTLFIVILIGVYIASLIVGGIDDRALLAVDDETLQMMQALDAQLIKEEYQIWRLGTSIFISRDLMHLAANILGVLLVGQSLEHDLSFIQYKIIVETCAVGGCLFSVLCSDDFKVRCGMAPVLFGYFGVYLACLIVNWGYLQENAERMLMLIYYTIVSMFVALFTGMAVIDPYG